MEYIMVYIIYYIWNFANLFQCQRRSCFISSCHQVIRFFQGNNVFELVVVFFFVVARFRCVTVILATWAFIVEIWLKFGSDFFFVKLIWQAAIRLKWQFKKILVIELCLLYQFASDPTRRHLPAPFPFCKTRRRSFLNATKENPVPRCPSFFSF